ncbi:Ppx/GppA phosphatase family protein [Roseibium litorale]|uniref:Ppx/GppA family phosphatase n=1 Tax=Roseibium litorale TaxID=2803841 RepID=A0ABR9CJH2_9HYPH|nr:Ppx/GppA phosphatase family protein [Roseibium litorale]MBD8890985.1 Ppx/GppA family phosphatase [Roseibium litorale]
MSCGPAQVPASGPGQAASFPKSSRKNRKRRGKRPGQNLSAQNSSAQAGGQDSGASSQDLTPAGQQAASGTVAGEGRSKPKRRGGRLGAKAALARKGARRADHAGGARPGLQLETAAPESPAETMVGGAGAESLDEARSGGRRRGRRRRMDSARTADIRHRDTSGVSGGVSGGAADAQTAGGRNGASAQAADTLGSGKNSVHTVETSHRQEIRRDGGGFPVRPSEGVPYPGPRVLSSRSGPLYAALDLGTNNCRLLIARPEERGFRVVDAYSRIVRLGEGVGASRRLGEPAMERAIEALANCHRKLLERGVERSRLIATEACRAAENGDEFIARVKSETGLALEVVNRETEARLAVAGCVSLVDQDAEGVILFDIGGGSSEIVWLDLRNRCGARGFALTRFIRAWTSLPVGVVNLAERHGGVDVTHGVFEAMVADVASHLQNFDLGNELTAAIAGGGVHMLGTSGTVTTLAGVHLGLKRYDRRRVDGAWLENDQVSAMIDHLREMPYDQRVENPCIGADRADLVLAGCAILEAIRRRWSCSRLRVADRGLREGILTELMAADGVWSRRTGPRRPSRQRGRK